MEIKEYILPEHFIGRKFQQIPAVFTHAYRTEQNSVKNRVTLSTHLFSFLNEGEKEIVTGSQSLPIELNWKMIKVSI